MYKVKNPCKYCYRSVTSKTGLQCKGQCQSWAHYKCLPYTPGKIRDIKAGYIKINCPCPNCGVKSSKKEIPVKKLSENDVSSVYSLSLASKPSRNDSEKQSCESKNFQSKYSTASILRVKQDASKFRNSQVSFGESVRYPSNSTCYSKTNSRHSNEAELLLTIMDKMYQTVESFNDQIKDLKGKMQVVLEKS